MSVILRSLFKDRGMTLMIFCLAGILLLWLYVAFFPMLVEQADNLRGLMESLPKGFLRAFGIENLDIFNIEGFLTYKHYSLTVPLMLIFLMASLAGSGLSGEVERGTIEISMSCPISRLSVYFGLYLTGFLMLTLFTVCAILTIYPISEVYNAQYFFQFHFLVAIMSLLFGWVVFSLSMMISAMHSEQRRTYMMLGGVIFVMYILDLISALVGAVAWMKYFSFFYYYNPNYILMNNSIPLLSILVFAASALVFTGIGAIWFNNRDIAI